MNKMMALVFIALGLLAGPGLYFYAKYYSGEKIASNTAFDDNSWAAPIAMNLNPDMNPIALNADVLLKPRIGSHYKTEFTAKLTLNGQTIWQAPFHVSGTPKQDQMLKNNITPAQATAIAQINTFEITQAGEYLLAITPQGKQDLEIKKLDVITRENAKEPPKLLLMGGLILVAIGFALLFLP